MVKILIIIIEGHDVNIAPIAICAREIQRGNATIRSNFEHTRISRAESHVNFERHSFFVKDLLVLASTALLFEWANFISNDFVSILSRAYPLLGVVQRRALEIVFTT